MVEREHEAPQTEYQIPNSWENYQIPAENMKMEVDLDVQRTAGVSNAETFVQTLQVHVTLVLRAVDVASRDYRVRRRGTFEAAQCGALQLSASRRQRAAAPRSAAPS